MVSHLLPALCGPSFFLGHGHRDDGTLEFLAAGKILGDCIASERIALAAEFKSQRAEAAAAVHHRNDEAATPTGATVDDMQVLHHHKRAHPHPICDF
jgi:hypothetical protein